MKKLRQRRERDEEIEKKEKRDAGTVCVENEGMNVKKGV